MRTGVKTNVELAAAERAKSKWVQGDIEDDVFSGMTWSMKMYLSQSY